MGILNFYSFIHSGTIRMHFNSHNKLDLRFIISIALIWYASYTHEISRLLLSNYSRYVANLNMKAISFFYSPCIIMHSNFNKVRLAQILTKPYNFKSYIFFTFSYAFPSVYVSYAFPSVWVFRNTMRFTTERLKWEKWDMFFVFGRSDGVIGTN